MRYVYLFVVFLFICSSELLAQRVLVVDDNTREFIFSDDYLHIYEDKEGKLSIHEVSKVEFQPRFKINKGSYPYNENVKSAYWIKFRVKNNAKNSQFLLESYAPHTNNWDVYLPDGNGNYAVKKSGINIKFFEREFVNKNLILSMPLDTGRVHDVYVRVLSDNHSSFDYRFKKLNYFFFYSVNEYYFLGLFYGIMLIMALYNFLIFLSLRERVYIYYVLYVLAGMLTTLADDSIGSQYLWVNKPSLNTLVGSTLAPLFLMVTFVLYSREFLRLPLKYKIYDKVVLGATGIYITYFLLRILFPTLFSNLRGIYIIPFILVYIIAVKIFADGYKPARYLLVGFGFILISIVIIKLRANGSIEGNLFTVYSFNYGMVLEVLILSFALAESVKFAKLEREKALREKNNAQYEVIKQYQINEKLKDKVNRELEQKVAERTHELNNKNKELEVMNVKLKEMTDKANQMSIKLDEDNWKLQKKVLESIHDRLVGQEVSYEEFKKLFPNESSCYRYLYDLKWEKGFSCYKCKYTETYPEEKIFTKKCARCGYIESATANTIFHALKFPIDKAFYILYMMVYQQDRMTLVALSELIQLRKNTCWNFKQKIFSAIELIDKGNKRGSGLVKSWENIIFASHEGRRKKKTI